jgi:hypothetical protein
MSRRLYDCQTALERLEWIKARLLAGATVSENTLALGGVEVPHAVISGLRASGMEIETLVGDLVDSKGVRHRGAMSWRLLVSPMGREAANSARQRTNATIKHPTVPELKTGA